jgi:hypothetical protein
MFAGALKGAVRELLSPTGVVGATMLGGDVIYDLHKELKATENSEDPNARNRAIAGTAGSTIGGGAAHIAGEMLRRRLMPKSVLGHAIPILTNLGGSIVGGNVGNNMYRGPQQPTVDPQSVFIE